MFRISVTCASGREKNVKKNGCLTPENPALFCTLAADCGNRNAAAADLLLHMSSAKNLSVTHSRQRRYRFSLLFQMAMQNIFRDHKQAVLILLSFITALSVFFTVNTAILGNDAKHILNQTGSCDIQFVNQTMLKKKKQIFTKEKIETLKAIDGVKTIRQVTSAPIDRKSVV